MKMESGTASVRKKVINDNRKLLASGTGKNKSKTTKTGKSKTDTSQNKKPIDNGKKDLFKIKLGGSENEELLNAEAEYKLKKRKKKKMWYEK